MVKAIFYILEALHKFLYLGVAGENDKRGIGTTYVIDLIISYEHQRMNELAYLR